MNTKTVKVTKKIMETLADEKIKVKIVSFNKMDTLNSVLDYFEVLTGLKPVVFTDSNFNISKTLSIRIYFPTPNKFPIAEAYAYLAALLYYNDIVFTIYDIDGASYLTGVAKYKLADKEMQKDKDRTVLSCTINTVKGSTEFDNIISIIEILYDVTIDIVKDSSELNHDKFYRSVLISIPNTAVNDFTKIIDKKDFINLNK